MYNVLAVEAELWIIHIMIYNNYVGPYIATYEPKCAGQYIYYGSSTVFCSTMHYNSL